MDTRRSADGAPVISLPPMSTRPLVTSSRPAIMRKVVDLPHPDGPRRTTKLPSSASERDVPDSYGAAPGLGDTDEFDGGHRFP